MIQAFDITLFWWTFLAVGISSLIHIISLVISVDTTKKLAILSMIIASILLLIAVIVRSFTVKHLPVSNMFEFMMIFALALSLFYFLFLFLFKQHSVGVFVTPLIFVLLVSASLLPKEPSDQLVPALQSIWLQIHVTLAAIGEAAFGVAFAVNIMFFIKKIFNTLLPNISFEKLDIISHKAIIIGYPLFTIGALFAGAIWAEQAWGSFWSWDPKEVCSLLVWLIYTFYFHVRIFHKWRGLRCAIISSIGFIATIFTFFANIFLGGLHSYL
ncbi:MAG: c-type cytochrome biogenesis protein CcsB [Chitinispirillaceae bacterium]|nr:c-type cytochrome biogenesis protein CcsB [Chitinispirillaceae bacterium]